MIEIQYNCLNLPSRIQFEGGNSIAFLYDANGTKIRTTHIINGVITSTDYCDNAIYENGVLDKLLTGEGYITLSDTVYHYFLRDHQGNNRVVVSQDRTVEEVNHYYPFGGCLLRIHLFSLISIMARNWIEETDWIGMITGLGCMIQFWGDLWLLILYMKCHTRKTLIPIV